MGGGVIQAKVGPAIDNDPLQALKVAVKFSTEASSTQGSVVTYRWHHLPGSLQCVDLGMTGRCQNQLSCRAVLPSTSGTTCLAAYRCNVHPGASGSACAR